MAQKPLSKEEITKKLSQLPDWSLEGDELIAEFEFADFKEALKFMVEVGSKAEEMNHHPTWTNTYNKVAVRLSTHDAGGKVTELDLKLAEFISKNAGQRK